MPRRFARPAPRAPTVAAGGSEGEEAGRVG